MIESHAIVMRLRELAREWQCSELEAAACVVSVLCELRAQLEAPRPSGMVVAGAPYGGTRARQRSRARRKC